MMKKRLLTDERRDIRNRRQQNDDHSVDREHHRRHGIFTYQVANVENFCKTRSVNRTIIASKIPLISLLENWQNPRAKLRKKSDILTKLRTAGSEIAIIEMAWSGSNHYEPNTATLICGAQNGCHHLVELVTVNVLVP
uniref:Reverse transcriptase n=1 Tax=Angiostrongylus cantonensis TaxID=6313 RepID=A0A158PBK9_ANGCA